jgi:flavin-dependent dehydrogenase
MHKRIDYLIIGAGPAGLQLSYFLSKKGRDYLVLEKASKPANFFVNHPRHRKLIVFDKLYTGKTSYL